MKKKPKHVVMRDVVTMQRGTHMFTHGHHATPSWSHPSAQYSREVLCYSGIV